MLELGRMYQMKQWDLYYVVLAIDFNIPKKGLLKKDDLKRSCKFTRKVTKMLTDKFWEKGISFYIDVGEFQHKYNSHKEVPSIQTMAWQLKNAGLYPHCISKGFHVGSGGRVAYFIVAIAHQKGVVLCKQHEGKLMVTCSQISSKHTFKKLSVDARFQKTKGFFRMDVLYKTVKRQDKLWIQLSNQI